MNILRTNKFWILTSIILVIATVRVALVSVPNVAPIAAMALFGGAYFGHRMAGVVVPIVALFLGDLFLELFMPIYGLHSVWPFTYGAFALIAVIGFSLRGRVTPIRVGVAGIAGAVLFFLASNFGVWLLDTTMFSNDFVGLMACYEFAWPYFRLTLIGDLFFVTVVFGGYALAKQRIRALA